MANSQKTAIVTGASQGIGAGLQLLLRLPEFMSASAGETDCTNLRQTARRLATIGCLSRFSS